ncbi:zinc finger protein OZF-like [Condylostylus longicornis]|uniref:zinc finger protein OZF-like n=1 Tax=Condylostylus longicornis TaxID=2530218 RepID=UPI00244E4940|nr:zinc finger protein OZF-like [Condylostylus longicornis]
MPRRCGDGGCASCPVRMPYSFAEQGALFGRISVRRIGEALRGVLKQFNIEQQQQSSSMLLSNKQNTIHGIIKDQNTKISNGIQKNNTTLTLSSSNQTGKIEGTTSSPVWPLIMNHSNNNEYNNSDPILIDDELSFRCHICDKVFGCSSTLETHIKTHKSPRYECMDCGKGFSQLRNYKYHLSVHRGTKEFAAECPECGKIFNDKGYLSSHMKIHRNKKEYECPYCPKSFNQRVAFNMHVRIHTGVKPHKCSECGKRFSRKMLLKQHMRTHSGEKPYTCSVCGKSFADRSNMTLHHRLHSGIKPFTCPICPKAFTKKHHLKTHLNYHTGCKPYVCPHQNCNQAFTQSSNMRTHAKKCQFKPLDGNIDNLNNTSRVNNANNMIRVHSEISNNLQLSQEVILV